MTLLFKGLKKWNRKISKKKTIREECDEGVTDSEMNQVGVAAFAAHETTTSGTTSSSISCGNDIEHLAPRNLEESTNKRKGIIGPLTYSLNTKHPTPIGADTASRHTRPSALLPIVTSASSDRIPSPDHDIKSAPYQTIEQFLHTTAWVAASQNSKVPYIDSLVDFLPPSKTDKTPQINIRCNTVHTPDAPDKNDSGPLPNQNEADQFILDLEANLCPGLHTNTDEAPTTPTRGLGAKNKDKKRDRFDLPPRQDPRVHYIDQAVEEVQSRKRKRLNLASYLEYDCLRPHRRTSNSPFNIFQDGFLHYPELCIILAALLPVQTLINLYSISKDFHIIANQRFTTLILNQASVKAPFAARSYHWRCYTALCQVNPSLRRNTESPKSWNAIRNHGVALKPLKPSERAPRATDKSYTQAVPTFRWLQFAIHREKTMWMLYYLFAASGVPLPGHPADTSRCSFVSTLHKLWFLFDIPDNTRRYKCIHSRHIFTSEDLSNSLVFLVKLDMVLSDPTAPEKRDALRKLLMCAVDGFSTLLRLLKREELRTDFDVIRMWTRVGMTPDPEHLPAPLGLSSVDYTHSDTVFGVPWEEIGALKKEFWGTVGSSSSEHPDGRKEPKTLARIDQLIIREVVFRKMAFGKQFLRALLLGYVDESDEKLGACPKTDVNGGLSPALEGAGEYEVDDTVAGVQALDIEDGGDKLLDLGDFDRGSPWTVVQRRVTAGELELRRMEAQALETYIVISEAERCNLVNGRANLW